MGDRAFTCSLNLSANIVPDSLVYSSLQSTLPHLYLFITPLSCKMVSLSLGFTRRYMMVLPPLKCIFMPCALQMSLQLSSWPLIYCTTMYGLLMLEVGLFLILFEPLLDLLDLMLALFKTQTWCLHFCGACFR